MLTHLLTNIGTDSVASINPYNADWQSKGVFRRFDQTEFIDDGLLSLKFSGLAQYGYLYYPHSCILKSCKVHMMFMGCMTINQGFTKGFYYDDGLL